MSDPIWQWTATRTARAIRTREISAETVAEAHVARMRAANPALNAVVVDLGDEAVDTARGVDQALARGESPDLLTGVPVTIKINVDYTGQANSNGAPSLANNIAAEDSAVVGNLRKAGAICIGLTNTPEFSMRMHTDNPLHGETLNPWDPAITCGGSSGGAGSATAMGFGCIGHGNDIGGSLRWPAHCNGIATIKPTQGRIPAFNPSAPAERPMMAQLFSTQGPLARSVADVRLGLEGMARRDPRDPFWTPAPLKGPDVAKKVALAKLPDGAEADPRIMALLRTAADALADAGWQVDEVEVPDVRACWQVWADILLTEMNVMMGEGMLEVASDDFKTAWKGMDAYTSQLDLKGFMEACSARLTWQRRRLGFLERYPVVLAPMSLAPTFARGADIGAPEDTRKLWSNDVMFIGIFNMLGLPSAAAPLGLVDGLPVGAQFVASRYREDVALAAAEAVEAKLGTLCGTLWAREA
ncbi:MAG: amidase [Rhodobacteraceae bacterium]|nr:amidase [Paracoccaceae bacterium]